MAHTFNPSTREAEAGRRISELKASLAYRVSSRTARATQRNPASKNQKKKKKKKREREREREKKEKKKETNSCFRCRCRFSLLLKCSEDSPGLGAPTAAGAFIPELLHPDDLRKQLVAESRHGHCSE